MSKQTELAQVADTITVDSGNVGIGTAAPNSPLSINNASDGDRIEFQVGGTVVGKIGTATGRGLVLDADPVPGGAVATTMQFRVDNSEAMRIDSSDTLLVGKTTNSIATAGTAISSTLGVRAAVDGDIGLLINRLTSDGNLVDLRKDSTTVGSIGVVNTSEPYFISSNRGIRISGNNIRPCSSGGANLDNVIDLGDTGQRFDDIYATNGTIQTSDRNEKQDIAELSDAEQRVAVAAKGLMRKFRWRDAVEAKGDDARTHFGIIAQDLQAAFVAEGLDAGDYAMFISSTWWETQTEVPAVEAVAEVLDEDGNVVTEAVEAADAYTRTDTYETQEEAPEGATERTRLGVRYSELLAFIIGAL